ncbi:hypothetical protein PYW08_007939 [Mythimna loreyi]|uniref:Uncharacterized protein n=1 Tax=Mythimna loreyi TaxID=667449 RepID=A0ACC2QA36_9NEOP|nr:hypothetical protein PYW08_007939 [Mythimna loreyi]
MVMMWVVLTAMVVAVTGFEINDADYHEMPKLFQLDDWEECLARRGQFCMGTFNLMPHRNDRLFSVLEHFSSDRYHFNHTLLHRGLCLSTSCSHIRDSSPRARFARCVNNLTRSRYGLEANLTQLTYCKAGAGGRAVDDWDLAFTGVAALIVAANVLGTAYDLLRKDGKPIKYLVAWSLVANWRRLTADHSDGDPRLSALKPVQGMKAITLLLVMMAHSVLAYHLTYIYNPQFFEKGSHHILATYMQNGTSIVQTFIMASSFLLAYNLLLHVADNPKKQLSIKMLPQCLMHRIARITPLYLFVLGLATTWWAHAGEGPMWAPMVEADSDRCRRKWWTQALYVNNFVEPDNKCLIHTWFLAVDMQLYVVCTILTLVLGRWPRTAVKVLGAMVLGSMLVNYAIIYNWQMQPMVQLMIPELMRTQFPGERSFIWLYSAPWDSLPSALIGLLVAFVYHSHQLDDYRPADSRCMRVLYRLSVPCMFAWVLGGFWMKGVSQAALVSLYAALDRPLFITLTAFAMYGFFNKIDSVWWKLLSWRGWEILGRMSLSAYLIHWLLSLTLLAQRTNANRAAIFDIGGHWLSTIFLTYWAALPLHLLIEVPAMRFLQSITS